MRLNPPSEHSLQAQLLKELAFVGRPELYWFAIPNAGRRSLRMGARMKDEGLAAGVSDLCFMLPGGHAAWMEMKRPGQYQSIPQKGFQARCERLDHPYAVSHSLDEAMDNLHRWGVLK